MKLHNIDLNKIAVFCQVVESGNFRRASEVLNVTPSALSQTIKALEHSIGSPLFLRVGKKLVPSPDGLQLQREFRRHHQAFENAVEGLFGDREKVSGLLRLGAYQEFAKFRLAPVIREFLRRHPEAQLKLVFDSPSRLHRLLEIGQLDLCFSIYPSRETLSIDSKPVYHEELVLVAPGKFFSQSPSYEELLEAPFVEYYLNHQPSRRWLYLHFRKKPKKLPIVAYAASAEMVLALVQEGVGVGIVPRFLLEAERKRNVKIIRPTDRRFLDHIWRLERKSSARTAVHRAFNQIVPASF